MLAAQGRHADFLQVTGDALDFALETLGLDNSALRERLLGLYMTLGAYPETAGSAAASQSGGHAARHTVERNAGDARRGGRRRRARRILRGDALGRGGRRLQTASESLSARARPTRPARVGDRLLSSNAWDAHAASAFGMQVVWCNRSGQRRERLPGAPDREIRSLSELPALVGAAADFRQHHQFVIGPAGRRKGELLIGERAVAQDD